MKNLCTTVVHTLLALACGAAALPASAQDWPSRPLKLVVPFPPGGASDIVARLISIPLGEKLKQPVLVDNRPGGGTTIGAKAVISANDGFHTLFVSNSAPISKKIPAPRKNSSAAIFPRASTPRPSSQPGPSSRMCC